MYALSPDPPVTVGAISLEVLFKLLYITSRPININ